MTIQVWRGIVRAAAAVHTTRLPIQAACSITLAFRQRTYLTARPGASANDVRRRCCITCFFVRLCCCYDGRCWFPGMLSIMLLLNRGWRGAYCPKRFKPATSLASGAFSV